MILLREIWIQLDAKRFSPEPSAQDRLQAPSGHKDNTLRSAAQMLVSQLLANLNERIAVSTQREK